jgi:hypothetical protein
MFLPIAHALEELEAGGRQQTSKQSHQFLIVITRGSFIIALLTAEKCFLYTHFQSSTVHNCLEGELLSR